MDIKLIKSQFPIFQEKINGKPLIYLDSANSSQKPKRVIDRISKFYQKEFSNIGRSVHSLAVTATNRFEETRDIVKKYINAKSREEIIFTKNATESINLIATTYGEKFIQKGDEILITELEHHSNYVPWHFIRQRKGAIIKFAECNDKGEVDVDEIRKLISSKTRIIALTHQSIFSVFTVSFFPSAADINVCQARVAHFTRIGNFFTPDNDIIVTFSFLLTLFIVILDPSLIIVKNSDIIFFAISKSFPFTISVIIDAEAIEIAHPSPSNETSLTFLSSSNFKNTCTLSPQSGLYPSASLLKSSHFFLFLGFFPWSNIIS